MTPGRIQVPIPAFQAVPVVSSKRPLLRPCSPKIAAPVPKAKTYPITNDSDRWTFENALGIYRRGEEATSISVPPISAEEMKISEGELKGKKRVNIFPGILYD